MKIDLGEANNRDNIKNNHNKSIVVQAGAGAGKTTILIERILLQLMLGLINASELVVITFTNAAAEELRTRLLARIRKEISSTTIGADEKNRLETALKQESLMQISTIHSFCKRLLTEQSFIAKLPLDVKLLDNIEAKARQRFAYEEWYKTLTVKEIQDLQDEFCEGDVNQFLFNTYMEICELPDDTVFKYESSLVAPGHDVLADYETAMITQLNKVFSAILLAMQTKYPGKSYTNFAQLAALVDTSGARKVSLVAPVYTNAYSVISGVYKLSDLRKAFAECQKKIVEGKVYNKNVKTKFGFENSEIDDLNAEFVSCLITTGFTDVATTLLLYQNALIIENALKARDFYRDYCHKPENRHEITNDALLQEALDLIKNNKEAREFYQAKFKAIYVDEFQDTDRIQCEMIELLCQEPTGSGKLKESGLFLVGDNKQSIYAFRGAEVEVYESVRDKYENSSVTDVETYELNENYRSEDDIISWVNDNFSSASRFTGYTNMVATNKNADGPGIIRGVYTLNNPNWKTEDKSSGDPGSKGIYSSTPIGKDRESDAIVAIIKELKANNRIYRKNEDDNYIPDSIRYSDFLILCRTKKDINLYANKLKKAGIPINLYGALDTEEEDVLIRFKQLYKFLANPYSKVNKYSAEEVILSAAVTETNEPEAKARLEVLKVAVKGMSAYETLSYLVHHLEYLMEDNSTGEAMNRAQSRLQQLLEYVQGKPITGIEQTLALIEEFMQSDVDKELSMERDADAVRFMNLHKAKGLEGNIVIVAARGQRKSNIDSYRNGADYFPTAVDGNKKKLPSYLIATIGPDKVSSLAEKKRTDEWIRQDYVEATRAREALIFMDALVSGAQFNDYDFSGSYVKNLLDVSAAMKTNVEAALGGTYSITSTSTPTRPYDTTSWDVKLDTSQTLHTICAVTPSGMETDDRASWVPGDDVVPRPEGSEFGIVMHRCFEILVDKISSGQPYDINRIIDLAIMEKYEDIFIDCSNQTEIDDERKFYKDFLVKVLNSFISNAGRIAEISTAKAVYTEMEFAQLAIVAGIKAESSKLDAAINSKCHLDGAEPYWINGQADLVVLLPNDTVKIYDYKSDHIGKETVADLEKHLSTAYDDQQEMYRYVVAQALGIPIANISYEYIHMYM